MIRIFIVDTFLEASLKRKIMNAKMQTMNTSIEIFEDIFAACTQPDRSISGMSLEVYKHLVDWGFVERYSISQQVNKWLYVTLIAMYIEKSEGLEIQKRATKKKKWELIQLALEKNQKKVKK